MEQIDQNIKQAIGAFKNHLSSQGRASATILAYSKDIEQLANFVAKSGKNNLSEITKKTLTPSKKILPVKTTPLSLSLVRLIRSNLSSPTFKPMVLSPITLPSTSLTPNTTSNLHVSSTKLSIVLSVTPAVKI